MTENPQNILLKSSQYAALSAAVAEIAADKTFNGILSQKKATKICQLCSDFLSISPIDKSSQTILAYCYSIMAKRPNIKEGNKIFAKRLADEIGAPHDNDTSGDDAIKSYVSVLKDSNVNLKIENVQHKNEIETLKHKIAELTKQLNQKEDEISQIQQQRIDPEELKKLNKLLTKSGKHIQKLEQENAQLQKELEEQKEQNQIQLEKIANLEAEISNNPSINELQNKLQNVDKEKSKLIELFDQVSQQYEKQAEELNEETSARSSLVSAIHKLTNMNQLLSDMFNAKLNENKELQQKLSVIKKKEEKRNENITKDQDFIMSIIPEQIKQQISNTPPEDQNKEIIQLLVSKINQNDPHEEEIQPVDFTDANGKYNDVLLSVISSTMRFISSVLEKERDCQWCLQKFDLEEMKKMMKEQKEKIDDFIKKSHIEISDLQSLFDSLILEIDPINAKTTISSILENYSKFETEKEEELFFLLAESINTGLTLRTFAENCRQQSKQQRDEMQQMKDDYKASKQAIELQYQNEIHSTEARNKVLQEENETIRKELNEIKHKLLSSLNSVNDNKVLHNLIKFIISLCKLESSNSEEENICNEEEQMLLTFEEEEEQELKEIDLLQLLEQKTEELSNFQEDVAQMTEQKKNLENEIEQMKIQEEENSKDYIQRIDSMEKSIKETEQQYVTSQKLLYNEIEALKQRNEELSKVNGIRSNENHQNQLSIEQHQSIHDDDSTLSLLEEQNEKLEHLQKENRRLSSALIATHDATIEVLEKMKNKSKQKQQQLEQTIKENEEKFNVSLKQLQDQLNEQKQTNSTLETENESLKKELSDTNAALVEEQSQNSFVRFECKLAQTNQKAMEEKLHREMANLETQFKIKLFASDTEFQTQLSAQKNQLKQLQQTVISTLCNVFPTIILPKNSSLTEQNLISSLQPIADMISQLERTEKHNESLVNEIHEARLILNSGKTDSLITSAKNVTEENHKQKDKIQTLENKLQSMKKEVIQARSISEVQQLNQEWDDWGFRTLLRLGNTCSSIMTPREVRLQLSEILSASLNQKRLLSNLYSLRAQKSVLLDPKYQHLKPKPITFIHKQNQQSPNPNYLSFRPIIQLFIAAQRMRRSPHLTEAFASSLVDLQKIQERANVSEDPKKPLFKPY